MKNKIDDSYYYNVGRINQYIWTDFIEFGKYEGKRVTEIATLDPQYLEWCIINLDNFFLAVSSESLKQDHQFSLSKKAAKILKLKEEALEDRQYAEGMSDYADDQQKNYLDYLSGKNSNPYDDFY